MSDNDRDEYSDPELDETELADPRQLTIAELEKIAEDAGEDSWDDLEEGERQARDDERDYYDGIFGPNH